MVTPAAGESVTEGTILEWRAKVGEAIKRDETIVEISTDKVDVELPAPASGTIAEILVAEGETVTVGQVIARIAVGRDGAGADRPSTPAPGTPAQAEAAGQAGQPPASSPAPAAVEAPAETPAGADTPAGVKVSPVAARAAAAKGVDLEHVSGSGPSGRITKSDVLAAADRGSGNGAATLPAPSAGEEETKLLRGGAAALARYMSQSLAIPTATSFRTLPVTVLDARRQELKAAGRRVSFTHLIAYAIAQAAEEMPVMRDHYQEVEGKPHRVRDDGANLGIAVDVEKTDGTRTLMVPVIRGRRAAALRPLRRGLRRDHREGASQPPRSRRPRGREHHADQPGRPRHGRLGPAADGRPGHDRRQRLDRLPGGAPADRRDDRRGEGGDDDLHLRPPHHPGGRVGTLPGADRGAPAR